MLQRNKVHFGVYVCVAFRGSFIFTMHILGWEEQEKYKELDWKVETDLNQQIFPLSTF